MTTLMSSTELLGGRLLREIAAEEGSLEEVSLYFSSAVFLIDKDFHPQCRQQPLSS